MDFINLVPVIGVTIRTYLFFCLSRVTTMASVASSQPAEVPTVEFEVLVYVWSRVLGMWTDLALWTLELIYQLHQGHQIRR